MEIPGRDRGSVSHEGIVRSRRHLPAVRRSFARGWEQSVPGDACGCSFSLMGAGIQDGSPPPRGRGLGRQLAEPASLVYVRLADHFVCVTCSHPPLGIIPRKLQFQHCVHSPCNY